jgi:heme exporter protein C
MKHWWKILAALLLVYTAIAGLLFDVPRLPILNETIRNLYFHVGMWFAMIVLMLVSMIQAIKALGAQGAVADMKSEAAAEVGMLLGILGLLTGMVWAQFTWGAFWVNDPKLNGTAVTLLIYTAYFILRGSLTDPEKRARISAVYNIFAFMLMIVFIGILPRLTDSLHPGNGGNPAFSQYDLDSGMRLVFYPAMLGWILCGVWIWNLLSRYRALKATTEN